MNQRRRKARRMAALVPVTETLSYWHGAFTVGPGVYHKPHMRSLRAPGLVKPQRQGAQQ